MARDRHREGGAKDSELIGWARSDMCGYCSPNEIEWMTCDTLIDSLGKWVSDGE